MSDADVKELTDKACVGMDAKSKVAVPGDKYAARLTKVMKGMHASIKGQPIDYKVYLGGRVRCASEAEA